MEHFFPRWRKRGTHLDTENGAQRTADAGVRVVQFSFRDLQIATDNFSDARLLGGGGFSKLFRAEVRLNKGQRDLTTVAVKRYHHNAWNDSAKQQIQAEVVGLLRLYHPNLVKLLGVCLEENIFVYEFNGGGDVEALMYACFEGQREFTWEQRLKVALEAARGLTYLHEKNVFHGFFKPANLLLDKNMAAKVTDFGIMGVESNQMYLDEPGSSSYFDPSYVSTGILHPKSDVFSFGLFLIELITGTRALDPEFREKQRSLRENTPRGDLTTFVDPRLTGEYKVTDVMKLAVIAKHATYRELNSRPAMTDILDKLEQMVTSRRQPTRM